MFVGPLLRSLKYERAYRQMMAIDEMAEGVRFELTREQSPLPVFKTGALNHSATLPALIIQILTGNCWRTIGEQIGHLLPLCYHLLARKP
jgi:hypothetical protein